MYNSLYLYILFDRIQLYYRDYGLYICQNLKCQESLKTPKKTARGNNFL